ncbi:MAG: hypothetical protein K6A93_10995 [Bacteroidaceae bacterium]|nr:hypothetical protein [Bacteroidaceae bacterium]
MILFNSKNEGTINDIIALLITVAGIVVLVWFFQWDANRSARMKAEKAEREMAEEMAGAERKQREHEEQMEKARRLMALSEMMKRRIGDNTLKDSAFCLSLVRNASRLHGTTWRFSHYLCTKKHKLWGRKARHS